LDFVDASIVSLADPTNRGTFFSSNDLEKIAGVAFDTVGMGLGGPFSAIFDDITFGHIVPVTTTLDGQIGLPSAPEKQGIQIGIRGLPGQQPITVDVLWRGPSLAARAPASCRRQRGL